MAKNIFLKCILSRSSEVKKKGKTITFYPIKLIKINRRQKSSVVELWPQRMIKCFKQGYKVTLVFWKTLPHPLAINRLDMCPREKFLDVYWEMHTCRFIHLLQK